MGRYTHHLLIALMAFGAGPALAESFPNDVDPTLDVIPTDAIRIEVDEANPNDCARQVVWAFNLPNGSLMFHPVCELRTEERPITSARNG